MGTKGFKKQIGEVLERTNAVADYIHIDEKGLTELVKYKHDTDKSREILSKYAQEDWVPIFLGSYDFLVNSVTKEVLSRNSAIEEQITLKQLGVMPSGKVKAVKPVKEPRRVKKVSVKASTNQKAYKKTAPKRFESKYKTKLFIQSRKGLSNKQLTKEYNSYAVKQGFVVRTQSSIVTLKSRVNRGVY